MAEYIQKSLLDYPDSDILTTNQVSNIFLQNIVRDYSKIPPWWTTERDKKLRQESIKNDFVAGLLFTLQTILYNINYQVLAKDNTIERHNQLAQLYNMLLQQSVNENFERFISDVLTLDNGGFLYIDGEAPPHMPLDDIPYGLIHRDSTLMTRTRNTTYPVVYNDPNSGKSYPLHSSRVITFCQAPSPQWDMNGVGYGTVSKIYILAQHLLDIAQYDAESLGSMNSTNLYVASGASSRDLEQAFNRAEIDSFNEGRTRSTKNVYLGFRDPQAKLNRYGFRVAPDGYDKQSDIEITLTQIALMIGVNPVILFDAVKSSSTRGGSKTAQKISESKLFSWFVKKVTTELNLKFLPQSLQIVRPGEDLDLDGTKSRIALNNSLARKNNIDYKITNGRVERERMLRTGEIDETQFEKLELEDGRLANGMHISTMFYDKSAQVAKYLVLEGIEYPLNISENNAKEVISKIQDNLTTIVTRINASTSGNISRMLWRALYALQWLENQYQQPSGDIDIVSVEHTDKPKLSTDSDQRNISAEAVRDRSRIDENNRFEDKHLKVLSQPVAYNKERTFTTQAERQYIKSLRQPTREFWGGEIDKKTYINTMQSILGGDFDEEIEIFSKMIQDNPKGVGRLSDIYSILTIFMDLTNK